MTRHRHPHTARSTLLRRLIAGAVLAAVVAGPPALLAALVGHPLDPPAALRDTGALTQVLDEQSVLWLLATTGWLLWAHLITSLAVEFVRQTRGSTLRLPLPGLLFGANTALASHLVASLLLTAAGAGHHGLTPAVARTAVTSPALTTGPAAAALSTALPETTVNHAHGGSFESRTPARSAPRSAALIECRVLPPQGRDHDTLWDIAERHLGDGTRWRDIYALNEGRLMPDGQRLTRASLIHPGWILQLPADAIALDIDRVAPNPAPATAGAAAPPASAVPRQADGADSPDGPSPTSAALPDPATPEVVDDLAVPAGVTAPRPPRTADGPSLRPALRPESRHGGDNATGAPAADQDEDADPAPAVAVGLLGLAALALLSTLTRRRRVASRRRPVGVRAARPTDAIRELEAQLRQQARLAEDTAAAVQLALLLASRHTPAPRLRAVWQHPDGSVELVLPELTDPPAPFTATGRGWLLSAGNRRFLYPVKTGGIGEPDRASPPTQERSKAADPFPLLMPVGSHDGSTCLVNLEVFGLISLTTSEPDAAPGAAAPQSAAGSSRHAPAGDGDDQMAAAQTLTPTSLISAWAQALAAAPWAELVRTYVPDTLAPITVGVDRLTVLDPTSDAARYATAELSPDQQRSVDRAGSLEQARRTDPHLDLVGVSLWAGYTADQLPEQLLRAATDPRDPNTVLLLGGHPDAHRWRLDAHGLLSIPGLADALVPLSLPAEQQDLVLRLLEHAEDPPQADPGAADRTELLADCPPLAIEPARGDPADPPPRSERQLSQHGRVLDLTAADPDRQPPSAEQADAQRPEPESTADGTQAATGPAVAPAVAPPVAAELPQHLEVNILGPLQIHGASGAPPRRQCLELLVYLALHRRPVPVESLWQAVFPDRRYDSHQLVNRMSELRGYARQKLPQIKRTYQLDNLTISDWQRFQSLAAGNPAQQLEALALVRGRPFEDLRADWIHLEGQLAEVEASIVDLALQVGERALRNRDPDTARTAALAGLRGCPWDERLYRVAMHAAAARGATSEVHQLRRQLQIVLDDELDPDDDMQPATQELYSTLRDEEHRRQRLAERRRNGA